MFIHIKIQESKIIEDMYSNEYLYFNSLETFKKSNDSDQSGRNDPFELVVNLEQLKSLSIKTNNKTILSDKNSKNFSGQYITHLEKSKINCCCLYWTELEVGKKALTFNERLLQMGDKMLIIYDCQKFFEILDENLEKLNYQYSRKKVSYFDRKSYNGELTLHQKDNDFNYQNEYRILFKQPNDKAIKIYIPGLKNISTIINSKDYDNLIIQIQ